ncbi:signal peptidase II [Hoeflea marina]|uniref:Lipoprotein signal peptidase n=1 Tax=Hoeflea marina TaxID=274592 RepID=A0A317PK98_9HYPH|nr:signal peptidase II [Hoeflea marina]PWW00085.1 signal peptidase II [Hoeflea marina]
MTASRLSRVLPMVLAVGVTIGLDQAIKWLVEAYLPFHQLIPVAPLLALYRTWNTGIAFSMLAGLHDVGLLLMTTGVVTLVIFLWWRTPPERRMSHLGYALIIGGALGNMIDRAVYGHVVDYILFHTTNWSFAVFNLADACISVGAGLIALDEVLVWRRQRVEDRREQDERR